MQMVNFRQIAVSKNFQRTNCRYFYSLANTFAFSITPTAESHFLPLLIITC